MRTPEPPRERGVTPANFSPLRGLRSSFWAFLDAGLHATTVTAATSKAVKCTNARIAVGAFGFRSTITDAAGVDVIHVLGAFVASITTAGV